LFILPFFGSESLSLFQPEILQKYFVSRAMPSKSAEPAQAHFSCGPLAVFSINSPSGSNNFFSSPVASPFSNAPGMARAKRCASRGVSPHAFPVLPVETHAADRESPGVKPSQGERIEAGVPKFGETRRYHHACPEIRS